MEKERRRPVAAAGHGHWRDGLRFDRPGDVAPAVAPNAAAWADAFDDATLPAGRDDALGIDHFDHRLEERDFAAQTLRFIERVVHCCNGSIRIVCNRDPIVCLRESGATAAELDRWSRALASFQMEIVGVDNLPVEESKDIARRLIDNPSMPQDQALDAYGVAAAPKYEALWRACTTDEQLALYQLAHEGLVDPQNQRVVQRLMRVGLVIRDPIPRVMTETFRRFVLQVASPEDVSAWERRGMPCRGAVSRPRCDDGRWPGHSSSRHAAAARQRVGGLRPDTPAGGAAAVDAFRQPAATGQRRPRGLGQWPLPTEVSQPHVLARLAHLAGAVSLQAHLNSAPGRPDSLSPEREVSPRKRWTWSASEGGQPEQLFERTSRHGRSGYCRGGTTSDRNSRRTRKDSFSPGVHLASSTWARRGSRRQRWR